MDSSRLARTAAIAAMAAAVACPAAANAATTRYVKQGGLTSGSCLTPATACRYSRVLNDAAGPTQPGDTVMVQSGTYDVSAAEVLVQEQVHVVGSSDGPRPVFTGSDPNSPTFKLIAPAGGSTLTNLDIRADGNGSTALWADVAITGQQLALSSEAICAYLNAPASTLQDTTATASSTGSACITAVQPNTTLRDVDVTQSNAFGTALYFGNSGSTAEELFVISAGVGGLIPNTPAGERVVVRRSVISAAGFHGLATSGGPVLITDSFLRSGGAGGAALSVQSGDTQIRNVTAIAAGSDSHALRIESAPPASAPNLLARNVIARGVYAGIVIQPGKPDPLCVAMPPGTCIYPDHVPGTAGRSHSNVGSALGGVQDLGGNLSGPPGFVDAGAGDYRLAPGSSSIDAGTADPLNGPLDYFGLPRTLGAAPDLGAYEFDPGAPPGGGPIPPGAGPDTAAPLLAGAHVTNRVFARTRRATPVNARAKRGTAFVYRLSEAAAVTIRLERRIGGRRKGGRCVRPTRKLARAKRCNRYVAAGKLTRAGAPGRVSVPFSGRIGRRALPLGSYRATLRAADIAGNRSAPSRVTFRIVRR
jgi:hypothetical protein